MQPTVQELVSFSRWRCRRKADAGYALVEFAFALMILLVLTFGMIDLGFALYAANVVQSAAQAGARTALVDQTAAVATVHEQLGGLDPANVHVSVMLIDQERIDVEVRYQYEFLTPFLSQLVEDGAVTLTGQASMLLY